MYVRIGLLCLYVALSHATGVPQAPVGCVVHHWDITKPELHGMSFSDRLHGSQVQASIVMLAHVDVCAQRYVADTMQELYKQLNSLQTIDAVAVISRVAGALATVRARERATLQEALLVVRYGDYGTIVCCRKEEESEILSVQEQPWQAATHVIMGGAGRIQVL